MKNRVANIAWCALVAALALAAGGCSWLGGASGGDPVADLARGKAVGPERIAAALAATEEGMLLEPHEPYWPFRAGELYAAVDSTEKAEAHLRAALALDPAYTPAVSLLSKLYYEAGRHEEGIALLSAFLADHADAPDAVRAALALHLEAAGDVDGAQSVLNGCSSGSSEVRTARTFVSLRGNDPASALETARQALDANRESAANYNNYGIALLYAGRPVEARQAFLSALDLNDALPGALYNLAIVETYYFFDEEAGRQWFARYRQIATADPDDLASRLGTNLSARSGPSRSR